MRRPIGNGDPRRGDLNGVASCLTAFGCGTYWHLALKCEVDGPALGRFRLHGIASFQATQIVPEAYASSQHDWYDRNVQPVHKSGLEIVANHGWSATYPHVLAVCRLRGPLQRIIRARGEEVENGAASHFD